MRWKLINARVEMFSFQIVPRLLKWSFSIQMIRLTIRFFAIALGFKIVLLWVSSLIQGLPKVFASWELNFVTRKQFILYQFQFTRTVPKFTTSANRSVECTKLILMVWVNLKFSVVKNSQWRLDGVSEEAGRLCRFLPRLGLLQTGLR